MNHTIPFSSIFVGARFRKDYGDVEELAASILELGLIQPLVVRPYTDDQFELVAGGRRYMAITRLRGEAVVADCSVPFDFVPVYLMPHLTDSDDAAIVELEENIRRKEMSWQETALGIAEVHRIRSTRAASKSETWLQSQTGSLFNVSKATVNNAVQIAALINSGDDEILKCDTASKALETLLKRRQKDLEAWEAKLREAAVATRQAKKVMAEVITETDSANVPLIQQATPDLSHLALDCYERAMQIVTCADSIAWMQTQPPNSFDHAYFDIPYGIDADNLELKHIEETKKEHDRDENIALFDGFLKGCYRMVKPAGWCVFWCDIEHFSLLSGLAEALGFKTQRWPLIGDKRGLPNKNEAASYNTTKDFEIVLVCGKPGATLYTKRPTSFVPYKWEDGERAQYIHPFVKPHSAHEHIINTFFPPNSTVLDPCCGEGSGTLALLRTDRVPTAIDLVNTHVTRAREHVSKLLLAQCTQPQQPQLPL